MEEWQRKADDISNTLHAHKHELLAPGARAGDALSTGIEFPWAQDIDAYLMKLADTTDLTDPAKRDKLVPPFEPPKTNALEPFDQD